MMKSCIAIYHVQFEKLGSFEEIIANAGYSITYKEAGRDNLEEAHTADLTVFLGGPIGVYDGADYPFLKQEIDIAEHRLKEQKPMMGICLGAQIIAHAGGAKVYAGKKGKEIGWKPIFLTQEGKNSFITPFDSQKEIQMFHWHGDTFDLPDGATLLASTDCYKNQIFSIEQHVLAFQCHPELDSDYIERWLIGHALEIAKTEGVSATKIRKETAQYGDELSRLGKQVIKNWLEGLSL